ncbi:Roc2 [Drosophila busckii]|uniref:Roc2 n=1 Tax=Drosophila busckii TaxID=30019 RepID=A0A0M4E8L9_DROBS|nr:Roc2 [Drosophila busckii]
MCLDARIVSSFGASVIIHFIIAACHFG